MSPSATDQDGGGESAVGGSREKHSKQGLGFSTEPSLAIAKAGLVQ